MAFCASSSLGRVTVRSLQPRATLRRLPASRKLTVSATVDAPVRTDAAVRPSKRYPSTDLRDVERPIIRITQDTKVQTAGAAIAHSVRDGKQGVVMARNVAATYLAVRALTQASFYLQRDGKNVWFQPMSAKDQQKYPGSYMFFFSEKTIPKVESARQFKVKASTSVDKCTIALSSCLMEDGHCTISLMGEKALYTALSVLSRIRLFAKVGEGFDIQVQSETKVTEEDGRQLVLMQLNVTRVPSTKEADRAPRRAKRAEPRDEASA